MKKIEVLKILLVISLVLISTESRSRPRMRMGGRFASLSKIGQGIGKGVQALLSDK